MLLGFCTKLGTLRCALALTTLVIICAAPFADGSVHTHDWRLFPGVIAPAIMMMLAFVLPLDITMSRIFMSDCHAAERARLLTVIRFEIVLLVVMLLAWLPFMFRVLDFTPLG